MMDERGYYQKYRIERIDGKPVGWTFTLEDHDPLAVSALEAYSAAARQAGNVELADDLDAKVASMKEELG